MPETDKALSTLVLLVTIYLIVFMAYHGGEFADKLAR